MALLTCHSRPYARAGDFEALVAVLHPEVVLRTDGGSARPQVTTVLRGPAAVARRAVQFARPSVSHRPVLVSGAAGVVVMIGGLPFSVMGFTIAEEKIVEISTIADPERLKALDLTIPRGMTALVAKGARHISSARRVLGVIASE
jgi:hypothetical protein